MKLSEDWPPLMAALYLVAAVATYGHFVSRSDSCGPDKTDRATCAMLSGPMIAAVWPLYWSVKAWER